MSSEEYPRLTLADRRKKLKWSLNPRGTLWSSDDNKVGQRMLEKMGWKKGCGLGVNLQGTTTPVRLLVKNDTKGLGLNSSREDWPEHQSTFNKLLEELNGGVKGEASVSSLEQQSQQSRARVHYRKFVRGKDLSRCSEKDLQGILGKNVSNKEEAEIGERNVLANVKRNSKKIKMSSCVSKTGEYDNIVGENDVSCRLSADSGDNSNKTRNSHGSLKKKLQDFMSEVYEENRRDNFVTGFDEENDVRRDCDTETSVDLIKNKEVTKRKKHHLHEKNYKKQSVPEINHVVDDLQGAKMKKKSKKHKTNDFDVSQEGNIVPVIELEENCDFEDRTLSDTCDSELNSVATEQCDAEAINSIHKKKKIKKKRKDKSSEVCEIEDKVHVEIVETGISKRTAVTDLGFKGSNIMCIKGYGVTLT